MIALAPKPARPHQHIAEALAAKAAAYELQTVYACADCPMRFTTRVGLREHNLSHWKPPLNPVTRYWVDVKQLPALVIIRREK